MTIIYLYNTSRSSIYFQYIFLNTCSRYLIFQAFSNISFLYIFFFIFHVSFFFSFPDSQYLISYFLDRIFNTLFCFWFFFSDHWSFSLQVNLKKYHLAMQIVSILPPNNSLYQFYTISQKILIKDFYLFLSISSIFLFKLYFFWDKNENSMKNTFFSLIHIIYRSWLSIFIFDSIKNKNMTTVLLANPFIIKKSLQHFFLSTIRNECSFFF